MDLKIKGKIAVVTGGGNGIGRAIAIRLAEEGARVVVVDIAGEDAKRVAKEIVEKGGDAFAIEADATQEEKVNEFIRQTIEKFGTLDILVNNVGGGGGGPVPIVKTTTESWDRTIDLTLKSAFLCSRAAAPEMIKKRAGRIINISSISGKLGESLIGPYCAAKFGVIGLTQVMAKELGRYNITVNAVCPGYVFTPGWEKLAQAMKESYSSLADKSLREIFEMRTKHLTALGRPQNPEDVASLVAYLASEEAGNITGQAINVDGGAVMH
ncbi:MAG: SDR family oxidoreductase [Syntrophales bacterium]|nr:SDR family oxidoreductase [Syntrophales bacterium]